MYELGGVAGSASFIWAAIHTDAVALLADGLMNELLASSRYTRRGLVSVIRLVATDEALHAAIAGESAARTGRSMQQLLANRGVLTLRYNDGSIHTMREYAQMAIRTTTAKAYNFGTLNSSASEGVLYWEVFDGPKCGWTFHDDPEPANGKIVTIDEAGQWAIGHPNCRRSFGPRPDVRPASPRDQRSSVSPAQLAAQVRADQDRARRQRLATNARARQATKLAARARKVRS